MILRRRCKKRTLRYYVSVDVDAMADASSDHDTISLSTSCRLDSSLQNILKRVSREIHVRKTGRNDTKQPLPPVSVKIEIMQACVYS